MAAYEEAARRIPVGEGAQVIVAGGGAGGIAAALSARRMGCTVMLIDKALLLGGLATQGLINWIEPYCDGVGHRVLGGIPWELFRLAIRYGHDSLPDNWSGTGHGPKAGRLGSWFSPEAFMLAAEELLTREGVTLLLDTRCVEPVMENGRCRGVITEGIEGRTMLPADVVIDATGTCELFARAGAPTKTGENYLALRAYAMDAQSQREALKAGDPYVARRRLRFGATLSGKGQPEGMPTVAGVTARETTDFALAARRMLFEQMQREPRLAMDVVNLPQMAQLRTIRHIVGAATFLGTEDHARAEDSIGVIPDFMYPGRLYELPYRSLYVPGYAGLLTCGRTISAEGWGWHASRVLGPVFLTGQAVGTAARFMLDLQGEPWAVPVGRLQEALRETGLAMHVDELGK